MEGWRPEAKAELLPCLRPSSPDGQKVWHAWAGRGAGKPRTAGCWPFSGLL